MGVGGWREAEKHWEKLEKKERAEQVGWETGETVKHEVFVPLDSNFLLN